MSSFQDKGYSEKYVVGQCWVSDTELGLGVGKIQQVEFRQLSVFYLLHDETRTYAISGAPLTRILFEVGDTLNYIEDSDTESQSLIPETFSKKSLIIEHVSVQDGLLLYSGTNVSDSSQTIKVLESQIQPIVKINRPIERLFNAQIDQNKWFECRLLSYQYSNRTYNTNLSGLIGGRVSLLPHQLYVIHEVASRYAPRVLLADEVGLGKTIEAGGIIHQQIFTGKVQRVLIIVPESLIHQWLVEMLRKFNLSFSLLDEERCQEEEQSALVDNPFDASQLVICSLNFLLKYPERYQQCIATEWDLLVVDEAHHLKWSAENISLEYQYIQQLSQKIESILLLTATPEQLGKESHFARLRLLDPDRYQNYEQFIQDEKQYKPLAEIIGHLQNIQKQLISDQHKDSKQIDIVEDILTLSEKTLELPFFKDIQKIEAMLNEENYSTLKINQFINQLTDQTLDYHGTGRVLFRNTRSSIKGFPKRVANPIALDLPQQYIDTSFCPERIYAEQQRELNKSGSTKNKSKTWLSFDPRVSWLIDFLDKNPLDKVVLITATAQTAQELHLYLKHKANQVTAVFHEGLSLFERDRAAAFFSDMDSICQCLICSEIGSEGRNFQFSNNLVLFDLPMNPDLLEQRIGRLDRIGQKKDIILHIPYFKQSAQSRLYQWYDEGLNLFIQSCPAAQQVFELVEEELAQLCEDNQFFEDNNLQQNVANSTPSSSTSSLSLETLIKKSMKLTDEFNLKLEEGRDLLLEYNSCRIEIAKQIINSVEKFERPKELLTYLERVFDCFGLESEVDKEQSYILHETHEMQHSFSAIGEDGLTYTLNREMALSNEDMLFLTWEHPFVNELIEKVISDDLGSTSMITFSHPGIKAGQLYLEGLYIFDLPANKKQEGKQNMSILSSHCETLIVDINGNDMTHILNFDSISESANNLDKEVIQGVLDGYASELRQMQKSIEIQIKKKTPDLIDQISRQQIKQIDSEVKRLISLKEINPMVRDIEIDYFNRTKGWLSLQYKLMNAQLDSLRILISV